MTPVLRRTMTLMASGALAVALVAPAAIADDTDAPADEAELLTVVEGLRDMEIGYGAIAKLTNLASFFDMDALEYLELVPVVDGEFNFGERVNDLSPEDRAELKDQAKAYRDMVKEAKAEVKAAKSSDEDADDDEGEDSDTEEADNEDGDTDDMVEVKAELIAGAYNMTAADVMALREEGYGWGALFRLASFTYATGLSVDDMLEAEPGDGLALGKLRKMLTPEELEKLEEGPRNFGHLMAGKAEKPGKSDKASKGNRGKKDNGDGS